MELFPAYDSVLAEHVEPAMTHLVSEARQNLRGEKPPTIKKHGSTDTSHHTQGL